MQCIPGDLTQPEILFCTGGRLNNAATVQADVAVNSPTGLLRLSRSSRMGNNTRATAHKLVLGSAASVDNAFADIFMLAPNATVRGMRGLPSLPIETPCCAIPAATCGGAGVTVAEDQTRTLLPGMYGALTLGDRATVTLGPGEYTFCVLQNGKQGRILTMGATTVNVVGDFNTRNQSSFGPKTAADPYPKLNVGGTTFYIGASAKVTAIARAPRAHARMGRTAAFQGSWCVNRITTDKSISLTCPLP